MGVRFIFMDGTVRGTRPIEMLDSSHGYPAISPAWFTAGMTPGDVSAVMGGEPSRSGDLMPSEIENLQMLTWADVVAVSFVEGRLVSAQTFPVVGAGS